MAVDIDCKMGAKLTHEQCLTYQTSNPRFQLEHSLPSTKIHDRYSRCSKCSNWVSDELYWSNISASARQFYDRRKRIGEDRRK